MPYIDCKISKKLTDAQKDGIKTALGKAVSVIHKGESYLMVGIDDGYTLYMAGKKPEAAAYVSVSLYGKASPKDYSAMTAQICSIMEGYGIDGAEVYVTYREVSDWGWNGSNF